MIDPDGGRFTYLYDNMKQLTAVINPQNQRTSYRYDAVGRHSQLKSNVSVAYYSGGIE
jgi:uncharacterized protein RhaS with RHS repeats